MAKAEGFSFKSFKIKAGKHKKTLRGFLTRLKNKSPKGLDNLAATIDKEVWKEVDCLACANCCRTMTPTFTTEDINRIAAHFKQTPDQFKKKWLYKDKDGDWMNKQTPCQFLDLKTNHCSIYSILPSDCAGFPHLTKKKMVDYIHVHQQNIEYCPATFAMVTKMQDLMKVGK
ncbi:MAG: YkgJ family cysteine cluster protein [Bacteroidota bacterium]